MSKKRWTAVVEWSRPHPSIPDHAASETVHLHEYQIEEVEELQGIIEGGPDWTDTKIIDIQLRYNW